MKNLHKRLILVSGIILGTAILTSFSSKKTTICHKNKHTIHVSKSAIAGHIGHGDYIGLCKVIIDTKE